MQYESYLSGSPLIPKEIFFIYAASVFTIISAFYRSKKQPYLKLFIFSILFHVIFLGGFALTCVYFLSPVPQVVEISYKNSGVSRSAVEITFDRPVRRKDLGKYVNPEVSGIWLFDDPLYSTHLYRKLVFYPNTYLIPGKTYTINLTGIRNFLNPKSNSYSYAFKISGDYNVLGETTSKDLGGRIRVIGSFPQDLWEGVSVDTTIRIRFNQQVVKDSAQNHFSITPEVDGTFDWDGDTLVFTPSGYLDFDTRYTFFMSSGVAGQTAGTSNSGYAASFTTQQKITKLSVPSYLQKYSLSCEAAALRMVLSYRGVSVTEDEILQKIGFDRSGKRGNIWGNPYVGFVGSVRGKQMVNGYGVYWEPIARAANNYRYSKSFENLKIQDLTRSIQKGSPAIAWISIKGRKPTIWTTPTGDQIRAVPDEHTVVVTGFTGPPGNPSDIIVNDPLIGEAYWNRETFEKKWGSLGNSAVLVY